MKASTSSKARADSQCQMCTYPGCEVLGSLANNNAKEEIPEVQHWQIDVFCQERKEIVHLLSLFVVLPPHQTIKNTATLSEFAQMGL